MTRRTFVGVMVVALAVVVMAGGLLASNMGFKLNYAMNQKQTSVSNSGKVTLALPDNRPSTLSTSKDLMDDIGFQNVTNVQRFLKSTDGYQVYTGRAFTPNPNFGFVPGEAVFVVMKTTVNYIVVGSDNPTAPYSLNAKLAGTSNSGKNFFAYNYHQTAATSLELMNDIGFQNVTNVQKFIKSTDGYQIYTGRAFTPNPLFALTPGEGYFVVMKTTVNYTPSHY